MTNNLNRNIFLYSFSTIFILLSIFLFCSCSSIPNTISHYLDNVNNDGNEQQILNQQNHLDVLNNAAQDTHRQSYPTLSDEDFANFREVEALGLKTKLLYRSSSPIDNTSERAYYSARFLEQHSIHNIVNLENTASQALSFAGYNNSFYSKQNILFAPLNSSLTSEQTKESIKQIILFINESEGPVLIHCKDGAEKTGIVCAILQTLNCASYDYLKAEYIKSYLNLYIAENQKELIDPLNMHFRNQLSEILGLTNHNIIYLNLNKYTKYYLENCGLSNNEISCAAKKLRKCN